MSRSVVDVYASWLPIDTSILIGQLTFAETSRGGVFSFAYDKQFLKSEYRLQIDPQLTLRILIYVNTDSGQYEHPAFPALGSVLF